GLRRAAGRLGPAARASARRRPAARRGRARRAAPGPRGPGADPRLRPLQDRRILVTRRAAQSAALVDALSALGATVVEVPLIARATRSRPASASRVPPWTSSLPTGP